MQEGSERGASGAREAFHSHNVGQMTQELSAKRVFSGAAQLLWS